MSYKKLTLFFKDWVNAGLSYVGDIVENDTIMEYERICELTGDKPSRLFEHNAMRTAIKF
jgi:hypothetical protein